MALLLVSFVLLALKVQINLALCGPSLKYSYFEGSCYYVSGSSELKTWHDARQECLNDGGDLATINSQPEIDYINGFGREATWIGLNDLEVKNNHVWADGTVPTDGSGREAGFVVWNSGNPEPQFDDRCVLIGYSTTTDNAMDDRDCSLYWNYVCEKRLDCYQKGGECRLKSEHCCEEKMEDDPAMCGGNSSFVCCLPKGDSRSGGVKPDSTTQKTCPQSHQDCSCYIGTKYTLRVGTDFDPARQVETGCVNNTIIRGPDCPEPDHVCLKHRILNALKCFVHTCTTEDKLTIDALVNSYTEEQDINFCTGRCVRLIVPDSCNLDYMSSMCEDVGGAFELLVDNDQTTFNCCV